MARRANYAERVMRKRELEVAITEGARGGWAQHACVAMVAKPLTTVLLTNAAARVGQPVHRFSMRVAGMLVLEAARGARALRA